MKKLFTIILLALSLSAGATNYYVKNAGNDSYAGTSDGTAWETMWKVNNYSASPGFLPGDSIFFKRGETITNSASYAIIIQNSGTADNPIYVGSYGTGDYAIHDGKLTQITGSDVTGNWTNTSGNIWTLTTGQPGAKDRIFLDGTEIQKCWDTNVNATTRWRVNGGILYLYSVGNPASTYSVIANINKTYGINLTDVSYITISNIDIKNFRTGVNLTGCNGITIQNAKIGYNVVYWGVAMYKSATNYNDSITITNNMLDVNDYFFDAENDIQNTEDGIYITQGSSYVTVSYNTFINWGHAAFCVYDRDATEPISYFKVHDNYFTWSGVDYGRAFGIDIEEAATGSVGNEVYNNYVYNQVVSSQIQAPGLKVHHNIWNGTSGQNHTALLDLPSADAVSIVSYNGLPNNMEFDHNVFANSEGCGVLLRSSSPPVIQNNKFRNNIFYNNKGQYWGDQTTGYQYYQLYINDDPSAVLDNTYQNNLFYYPGVTDLIYYGRDATNDYPHTVAEFNAENGNGSDVISGNIVGDPLFISASDFHLQASSPARDAGLDVSAVTGGLDYDGLPLYGPAYDIGAYEYTVGVLRLLLLNDKLTIISGKVTTIQ